MPAVEKMKVAELRAKLSEMGLDTAGLKTVLVKRLTEALAKQAADDAPDSGANVAQAAAEAQAAEKAEAAKAAEQAQAAKAAAEAKAIESAVVGNTTDATVAADANTTAATDTNGGTAELAIKFGGVLPAGSVPASSLRVPQREGIYRGEGSTKIPGTQRLARDSGTHEFFGAIVKPASDPKSRKVKLNRPGITKSGRKWRGVKTKRSSTNDAMPQLKSSWDKKMQMKREKQAVQEMQRQMTDKRNELLERQRLERENKRKQKAQNREKSVVVQVIKNPMKLKKLKKSQLRHIRKGADPNAPPVQQV